MLSKNLKILILITTVVIFLLPFNKIEGLTTVPVSDYGARQLLQNIGGLLDVLNTQLPKLLNPLNVNTKGILESMTNEKLDKYLNDSLKFYELTRYVQYYENQLKTLEKETENYKKVQLEEAKIAGAYLALQEIAQQIKCTAPSVRDKFNAAIVTIFSPYDLANRALIGYFKDIINCRESSMESTITKMSKQKSSFVFLRPFVITPFLSQINLETDVSDSSMIQIKSAFLETELTIYTNDIINTISILVNQKVKEKVRERENEIGTIKPYYEKCVSKLNLDTVTDQGIVFCTDYKVYISGEDFRQIVSDLKRQITNPQLSFNQTYDYLMNLIKFNESTTALTVSNSGDIFLSEALKEKICGRFEKDNATAGQYSAYTQCLKDLAEKYNEYIKKIEEEIKRFRDLQLAAESKTVELENKAKAINLPNGCRAGNKYLFEIREYLETERENYKIITIRLSDLLGLIGIKLNDINRSINQMNSTIQEIVREINNLIDILNDVLKLAKIPLNIPPIAFDIPIFNVLDFILGIAKVNALLLPDTISKINNITNKISSSVDSVENLFNENIANINDFQKTLSETYDRYDILSANNRLMNDYPYLEEKLNIYEELTKQDRETLEKMGVCLEEFYPFITDKSSERQSSQRITIKPSEQKFSFFGYIENLFKPKMVKIIYNEK
ncbi:MAG: hypothetical protein KatS3mg096_059 [Candidatus Parcubacteria bacterium]|nr:MAG: hypothetical protein KatS3mg096_059 [Candidatus Parcubacteria bacterium]